MRKPSDLTLRYYIQVLHFRTLLHTLQAIQFTNDHVGREKTSVFCLLPCSPHRLDKVFGGNSLSAREVSGCDLCIDFNTRVHRNQVFYTCLKCQHAWQAYFF